MSEQSKNNWDRKELGALWKRKSQKGEVYFSGSLKIDGKDISIICFSNKNKKSDTQPDVKIYLSEKRGENKSNTVKSSQPAAQPTASNINTDELL